MNCLIILHLLPVGNGQIAVCRHIVQFRRNRIRIALKFKFDFCFQLFSNAIPLISLKLLRVPNSKTVRSKHLDFVYGIIDTIRLNLRIIMLHALLQFHALNTLEHHLISILKLMFHILNELDHSLLLIRNLLNHNILQLLAILVQDFEGLAEICEHSGEHAGAVSYDEFD